MHPIDPTTDPGLRLQALTQAYSRYSRSAGGLSAVAGGVACLVSYAAGALLPSTVTLQAVLIGIPALWLLAKQWLAHAYYQRFGHVEELATPSDRRYHLLFAGFTALISLMVVGGVLGRALAGGRALDPRMLGYCAVVLVAPVVVWRWLRTPLEFIVGVFLLCQAAVAFAGGSYGVNPGTAVFPIASVALIVTGLRDHRRFLALQAEMRGLVAERSVRG